MSGSFVSDDFDRADGDDLGGAWIPRSGSWGITSSTAPTSPGPAGVVDYPVPIGPPYPRRDGQPLRGWARLRFRLVLLSYGHSVSSLQRTARINVDGIPGVQTWVAFYAIIRRGRR